MNYHSIIQEELATIVKYYNPNELAYLALTSKVEATLQRKLAYRMQQRLFAEQTSLRVVIDWQDIDIAIISSDGTPEALFFIKSGAIPDETEANTTMIGFYPKKVLEMAQKAYEIKLDHTKTFALLFFTHQNQPIADSYKKSVKHDNAFLRAFKKNTSEEILKTATENIDSFFASKKLETVHVAIQAGECWGVQMQVHGWLIELE